MISRLMQPIFWSWEAQKPLQYNDAVLIMLYGLFSRENSSLKTLELKLDKLKLEICGDMDFGLIAYVSRNFGIDI